MLMQVDGSKPMQEVAEQIESCLSKFELAREAN
jgi:hypothetical protein